MLMKQCIPDAILREISHNLLFLSHSPKMQKVKLILKEIQHSVVPIRPYDVLTPRYENTRKSKFYHNKKSNL